MTHLDQEGWFTDPYGIHEARWLSQGSPTNLVRDNGVEGYDDPPDIAPTREPERIVPEPVTSHGEDLRRADDLEAEAEQYDPKKAARAAWDVFDRSRPPGL